ncbi:septum formation initiator family protein [Streptomyces sp. NPDC008125]|uniref:FtsB family cell division protein n=1 Tax=Streptomyces sp. NPDC008125 TaxID=3364811 RepID=UPI0036EBD838
MNRPAAPLKGRAARLARLMPSGPSSAARTPFMLLVVLLLGGGLISLLLLNSALNEGSFRLSELRKQTTDLTDEEQALQRDVDGYSQPDALERRARELGMVPGGSPAFLGPDGTVRGVPAEVTADPDPEPVPTPAATDGTVPDEEPRAAGATGSEEAAIPAESAPPAPAPSAASFSPAASANPAEPTAATTTPTSPGR